MNNIAQSYTCTHIYIHTHTHIHTYITYMHTHSYVTSDSGAVNDIANSHYYTPDLESACVAAVSSGCDMESAGCVCVCVCVCLYVCVRMHMPASMTTHTQVEAGAALGHGRALRKVPTRRRDQGNIEAENTRPGGHAHTQLAVPPRPLRPHR